MPTTLESVVTKYLRSGSPAQRTREEYATTLRKWSRWSGAVPIERLGRKEIREFLDWVHDDAASREGSNPGRTTNKVRSHLRAALSWAWEQDLLDALPRFPRHKPQRDVAGKHYLTVSSLFNFVVLPTAIDHAKYVRVLKEREIAARISFPRLTSLEDHFPWFRANQLSADVAFDRFY